MAGLPSEPTTPVWHVFEDIADAIPHMVWLSDPTGAITYHNCRILEYAGLNARDALGFGWTAIVHPDDLPSTLAAWAHSVKTGDPFEFKYRLRRADACYRWFLARAAAQRDGAGQVTRWVGSCTDIDDQKEPAARAEQDLRASEERLRFALQGARGGVWDWNLVTGVGWWSPETYELWGIEPGTQMQMDNSIAAIHPDDRKAVLRSAEEALDRNTDYRCEFRVRHPIKGERWMSAFGRVTRDESHKPTRLLGITLDVTDRNRLAAERDALLSRLQLHIQRMPLAYVLKDADFRIIEWNPTAERIFGFSREEMLGTGPPHERYLPRSFWEKGAGILARIRAGDMEAHSTNENLTKDGRTIICQWFNTPIMDDNGQFVGLLCLAADVTEQKSMEAQFRQAQKMEAFGQLAGGVAHDFNNLLTIINGYSEMLLGSLAPDDPSRDRLSEINKAGKLAAGLTRQLLAFSRKQVLAPRVLDLNTVVAHTASLLRRVIGEDVRLSTAPGHDLWSVKADPGQIEQVLLNLAVNAREAMPTGGRLTIETQNVDLDEGYAASHPDARSGPHVLLAVSDTGHGMPPEVRARIFEPFFTTKEAGRGTGLGLATVYGIVKQSGGHVGVYSEVGVGTTFKVYLPWTEAAHVASTGPPQDGTPARGTETVLVVEDEDGVRAIIRYILQRSGYTVLDAEDAEVALRVAEQNTFDLLVTDVVMPGLGGRELSERLRVSRPGLRVLYLSSCFGGLLEARNTQSAP